MKLLTNEEYFKSIISDQALSENQKQNLRQLRDKIENQIRGSTNGNPRVIYGGSWKKGTMIKAGYDLDIVFSWSTQFDTLKNLYNKIGSILQRHWSYAKRKRVGWQISFAGDFHIDVIPGIESSQNSKYTYLYNNDTGGRFQSSIDIQADHVKNANRTPTIKLMKLWKIRKKVPIKTFILECMIIDGCSGMSRDSIEQQLLRAFKFLSENIVSIRLLDPSNSNNIISDNISTEEKYRVKKLAEEAINARTWNSVFF